MAETVAAYGSAIVPDPVTVAGYWSHAVPLYRIRKTGFAASKAVAWSPVVQLNDSIALLPPVISSATSHCLFTILVGSATGWSSTFFIPIENLSAVPRFFSVARLGLLM